MPTRPRGAQEAGCPSPAGQFLELGGGGVPLRIVRSARKTLAIEVRPGREVLLRAPLHLSQEAALAFAHSRGAWIMKHFSRPPALPAKEYTREEERALRLKARDALPPLVRHYAGLLGVSPRGISVTGARTRFGSCSRKGRLSFSFRLMAYPKEAVEYVALHEAAHLRQLNHSPAFYRLMDALMPDHRERARLLKKPPEPLTFQEDKACTASSPKPG